MTHEEILDWIETQKVPPASVLIVDDVDDLDGLRDKLIKIKNIIGVVKRH